MDPLLLLSSTNPGPHRSQGSSPHPAGLLMGGWGVFWSSEESRQALEQFFFLQHVLHCRMLSGACPSSEDAKNLRTLSKTLTLGTGQVPSKFWEQIMSGWIGDVQRSLPANVPVSLCNEIILSGAPSERSGYDSWVVIKDSFRCRDPE